MTRPRRLRLIPTFAALMLAGVAAPGAGFAASDSPSATAADTAAAEAEARAEARARAQRFDAQRQRQNDLDAAVQSQRRSLSDQQRTNDRIGGSLDRLGADTDAKMRSLRP